MFPVGDTEVRGAGPGIVTIALIVINVLVFLFQLSLSQSGLESFVRQFGVVPAEIMEGNQLYSLITSMFLHGGWLHLISNMLFLWVFGVISRRRWGTSCIPFSTSPADWRPRPLTFSSTRAAPSLALVPAAPLPLF